MADFMADFMADLMAERMAEQNLMAEFMAESMTGFVFKGCRNIWLVYICVYTTNTQGARDTHSYR